MKNNIAFLYSNDHSLSCKIAKEVSDQMKIDTYIVENRAALMMTEDGLLKEFIIKEFGKESYDDNGNFNTSVFMGMESSDSPGLDRLQDKMNSLIIDELKSLDKYTLVISNQLIETGILYLSKHLIVCEFKNVKEYDEYVNINSIKNIGSYYIKPDGTAAMVLALRGCLIECWNYLS